MWADLEPRTADTGAPRLVPGSHLAGYERQLCQYRAEEPASSGFEHWDWPTWREWASAGLPSQSRAIAIERLTPLGVLRR
ncbi:MAG TPA: hypothetical protein VFQ44_05885 [Streptosporangiaceae bacterium]|nr:hypothetical protein [Streptosporangiaceae bacterium]